MDLSITTKGSKTTLRAPYHPGLGTPARNIGGTQTGGGTWVFDARDEDRVRDMVRDIFGTDGTDNTETVNVRYDLSNALSGAFGRPRTQEHWRFGVCVAKRWERDENVRLGKGVIILSGGFPGSGGSVKNPDLEPHDNTVVEIRDVPAGHPHLDIGDEDILDITRNAPDQEKLRERRARLLEELAEIDAQLSTSEDEK